MYDEFRHSKERTLSAVAYQVETVGEHSYLFATAVCTVEGKIVGSYTEYWDQPLPKEDQEEFITSNKIRVILKDRLYNKCKYPIPLVNDISYLISSHNSGTRTRA